MANSLPKVLFTLNVPADHLTPLDGIAELIMPDNGFAAAPREQTLELLHDCTGVISQGELKVDRELVAAAPNLKVVANAAMGIDNLDLEALRERKIIATNTPDAFAESTADHAIGLILDVTRRISETDRYVHVVTLKIHKLQARRKPKLDVRVGLGKREKARRQPFGREAWPGGDRQRVLVQSALDIAPRCLQRVEAVFDAGLEQFALLGQFNRPVQASKYRRAQMLLKRFDLKAERGWCDVKLFGG